MSTIRRAFAGLSVGIFLGCVLVLPLLALGGCSTAPIAAPSSFERCVKTVAGDSVLMHERIRAAEWCEVAAGKP